MAAASHPRTLLPGEVSHLELQEHAKAQPEPLPGWVVIVDHVLDRLPGAAQRLGVIKLGPGGGHIIALWIVLGAGIVGGVVHVMGDGTLRAKVDRTECHVEWLVERAVAEDRGEPPPPFSPLACRQ
mgnify:CR=1 FL=1